jgi:hypothetical protein
MAGNTIRGEIKMSTPDLGAIEQSCRAICTEGKDYFLWTWDDRFDTVISPVKEANSNEAKTLLKKHLFGYWDYRQIHMAPHEIRRIAELIGGIGDGQIVFASDPDEAVLAIGVWWPWSSGSTISLRIGLVPRKPEIEQAPLDASLKEWFSI